MARSAAALVQGFERFDPALQFAGVVFNKLGSLAHLQFIREAIEHSFGMPLIGGLIQDEGLRMAERHLGLVTAEDSPLDPSMLCRLSDHIESAMDLDLLLAELPEVDWVVANPHPKTKAPAVVRIGVARDPAFCFYYQDNLDLLCAAGARLVPISPLNDGRLPDNLDGLYLGGGYPELYARRLADR